jgi:hypothetical protein
MQTTKIAVRFPIDEVCRKDANAEISLTVESSLTGGTCGANYLVENTERESEPQILNSKSLIENPFAIK